MWPKDTPTRENTETILLNAGDILEKKKTGGKKENFKNKETRNLKSSLRGLKRLVNMIRETGIPDENKWNNTIEEIFHRVKLENDPDTSGWRTDTSEKRTRLSAIQEMTRERKRLVNMGKMATKKEAAQQFITSRRQQVEKSEHMLKSQY